MIERKEYMDKLIGWKDEQVIKVVTGIRRCGKSTLLQQYQEYLQKSGIDPNQIITVNFEELEYESLLKYEALYAYIKERMQPDKMNYIFLDEIQKVEEFQKVVDSLYVKGNTDVYITGSNAYLLSGDLATLLTGRYVEISMLPLSYKEYCEATGYEGETAFREYLQTGGLPYISTMSRTTEKVDTYLEGIYNTVIVKDIEERQKRKETDPNKRKIADIGLLKTIAKYLASTIGSPISIKSVTNYLTSNNRKVSATTVSDYMDALSESFIFYPTQRFDIVGKQLLQTGNKWYMVDIGLRNHILPRANYDIGFSLENIVFLELLRRGYRVNVGKAGNTEVDFVAQQQGVMTYIQVTADMVNEETFQREMKPLKAIKDNYEKIVLTLDRLTPGNYNGIKVINALDWLLKT